MRVLIADDEESIVRLLKKALTKAGCAVETATNGLELLELWKISKPLTVLTDVNMPHMSGIDACQAIKALNTRVKIILMTGSIESYDAAVAAMLGPVIKKPFSLPELTTLVLSSKTWRQS